jgi:hypothetical protein
MAFGTPKHGGNGRPIPKALLGKDGGSIQYRVLPPILSCVETGEWAVGHAQHFGYDTPNPQDPSKRIFHPFYCVEIVRWESGEKVVVQRCPECDDIKQRLAEWQARKAEMEKAKVPEDQIRKTLEHLTNWLKRHNRDFSWYFNIKDTQGNYSTRKGSGKYVKKPIDAIVKANREKSPPYDPIAAHQGLWFISTKIGKQLAADWTLSVATEDRVIEGETFSKPKAAPLTEQDAAEAEKQCCDLHDVGIRRLSYDKVKLLVESSGDESVIKAIFGSSEKNERAAVAPALDEKPKSTPAPAAVGPAATKSVEKKPAVAAAAPVGAASEDDEVAKAMKALQEAQARSQAKKAAVAVSASTPAASVAPAPSPAPAPDQSSDEPDETEFLEQFRV